MKDREDFIKDLMDAVAKLSLEEQSEIQHLIDLHEKYSKVITGEIVTAVFCEMVLKDK